MEVYYAFSITNEDFSAYTENKYLMDKYLSQFPKTFNIISNLVTVKNINEFLNKFNEAVSYMSTSMFRIDKSNKLYSIKDDNSDEIFVINKIIYQKYVSQFCDSNTPNKLLYRWYTIIGQYAKLLYRYLIDEEDKILVNKLLYTIYDSIYLPFKTYLNETTNFELHAELLYGDDAYMWIYFNEYYMLKEYFTIFVNLSTIPQIVKHIP